MHRKYTSMKNALSVYGAGTQRRHRPVERDPSHPDFQSIASKYQHDPERSRQRMRMREERLRARESYDLEEGGRLQSNNTVKLRTNTFNSKSFKYMRRQPTIVQYDPEDLQDAANAAAAAASATAAPTSAASGLGLNSNNNNNNNNVVKSGRAISGKPNSVNFNEIGMVTSSSSPTNSVIHRRIKLKPSSSNSVVEMAEDGPGKKMQLKKPLEIYIDGPFGAPSSNIFRAEHAVLIGTGIGVTPFASILQSIMHRYWEVKRQCPQCQFQWSDEISSTLNYHLKKVRSIGTSTYLCFYTCMSGFWWCLVLTENRIL